MQNAINTRQKSGRSTYSVAVFRSQGIEMVFHEGTGTAVALADCAQNVTPCEFMSPGKVDRIVERRGLLQLIPQKRPSREKSRVDGNRLHQTREQRRRYR